MPSINAINHDEDDTFHAAKHDVDAWYTDTAQAYTLLVGSEASIRLRHLLAYHYANTLKPAAG